MKKLLFFASVVIIGQSMITINSPLYAMNTKQEEDSYKEQNERLNHEREWRRQEQERVNGTREDQRKMKNQWQETNRGYGRHAAQKYQNLYQIIGVSSGATTAQISSAYRKRALELKKSGDQEEMKRLNHAKDILTDSKARSAYDNEHMERVD